MINVDITIDPAQMAAIERRCSLLMDQGKIDAAINRATKRAADAAKAETKRQITEQYTIGSAHTGKTIKTAMNSGGGASMRITDSPNALPKFAGVTPNKPASKKPAGAQTVAVKAGGGFSTKDWFPAKMKSGHVGIFRRMSGSKMEKRNKEQIEQKFGPATAGMFKSDDISKSVTERAQEVLADRLDHEIERLLYS